MKRETALLLQPEIEDPQLADMVEGSIDNLALATRPPFLNSTDTPVTWGPEDWEAMEAARADIFNFSAIESQFDPERFLSEGYAVLEGVMTDRAREMWVKAAKAGQHINDTLLQSDWRQIDWRALGRTPPDKSLTAIEIENAIEGSQQVPRWMTRQESSPFESTVYLRNIFQRAMFPF